MQLRSGRIKSSLPPPVRRRLPVLRHRGGVRFSHTRAGDLYQQVRRCWVYRQPESHPEVNIFAKREAEVYNAWLEYRRREMDLMKPYSVRSAEVISRSMGVTTRRRALRRMADAPLGGNGMSFGA